MTNVFELSIISNDELPERKITLANDCIHFHSISRVTKEEEKVIEFQVECLKTSYHGHCLKIVDADFEALLTLKFQNIQHRPSSRFWVKDGCQSIFRSFAVIPALLVVIKIVGGKV